MSDAVAASRAEDHGDRPAGSRAAWIVGGAAFLLYTALALRLHQNFETRGYDLGIFGQYAKAFAHGQAPLSAYRVKSGADLGHAAGLDLFGDHFSPVLALLGPVYRLVPHVETILVVQAALVAVSVVVVTRCATKRLGSSDGVRVGTAYALSWGVQQLIGFDFHEVAFALPLLSLAVVALLDGRHRTAAVWAASLLLVKEDLGMTVFVFGLLMWRRDRRTARVLCVLGPVAVAVTLFLLIPHYATADSLGRVGDGSALSHPWLIPVKLLFPPVKLVTVLMTLAPTGFLARRSPIILLAVPTLFWRFTADTPNYWGLSFHYSAVLMPIVFLAMIDALSRSTDPRALRIAPRFALVLAIGLCAAFPLNHVVRPDFWHTPARAVAARHAVDRVPVNARVAATGHLVPHLVDKATVYQLATIDIIDQQPLPVEWVVVDTTDADIAAPDGQRLLQQIRGDGFSEVQDEDGFLVLHRS